MQSLIGHFDLDPNRVFDIVSWMPGMLILLPIFPFTNWLLLENSILKVLECFELQLDNSVFLDLIPIFPKVLWSMFSLFFLFLFFFFFLYHLFLFLSSVVFT